MAAYVIPDTGEPFEFVNPSDGKTYRVPRLADLPDEDGDSEFDEVMDGIEAANGDNRKIVRIACAVFERHAPGSTKGLTFKQKGQLSDAWATETIEDAGEDGSSSD